MPSLLERKREELFTNLALIHTLCKVIQIAYFASVKGTNFRKQAIRSKSDLIHKLSEDIINSMGDAVRLREDKEEYMDYNHFVEVYELVKEVMFLDTESVSQLTAIIKQQKQKSS